MFRRLTVVIMFAIVALMPFGASAQTPQTVFVQVSGQASTSEYFIPSGACDTSAQAVTYLFHGGPSFTASGVSPASGSVYQEFVAVGSTASGEAYFYDGSTDAFQFWFEGAKLTCDSPTSGTVAGYAAVGYTYSYDPTTGTVCQKLSGWGNVIMSFDFASQTVSTRFFGAYHESEPTACVF